METNENVNLSGLITKETLLNDINEAIATLLSHVDAFECIEDVNAISAPLLMVRIALMKS